VCTRGGEIRFLNKACGQAYTRIGVGVRVAARQGRPLE
jgi:hypothetical protein